MANEITSAAAGIADTTALTTTKSSDISMDDFLKILAASMTRQSVVGIHPAVAVPIIFHNLFSSQP